MPLSSMTMQKAAASAVFIRFFDAAAMLLRHHATLRH
jgi:hypothetical protein